nr:hypothetical protein [Morchella crassipes]
MQCCMQPAFIFRPGLSTSSSTCTCTCSRGLHAGKACMHKDPGTPALRPAPGKNQINLFWFFFYRPAPFSTRPSPHPHSGTLCGWGGGKKMDGEEGFIRDPRDPTGAGRAACSAFVKQQAAGIINI